MFADDLQWCGRATEIAALAADLSELMDGLELQVQADFPALPIAYHDACSLQHGQRLSQPPRRLLNNLGFAVKEVAESHFCCGSAGTYNLLQNDIATRLGRRKAAAVDATGAVAVAAGNLGCLVQIGHYADLPVVHTAELLDWATGGPRPLALADLDTRPWPARPASIIPTPANGDDEAINFWAYAP